MKLECSRGFRRILKYQISRKSVPWEPSCSMQTETHRRTDGRTEGKTDMTKLIVAFHNFAKAPKKKSKNVIHKVSETGSLSVVRYQNR
jgi:hypothetical protein